MKLDVIFRSCSGVNAVHGNGRPFDLTKTELMVRCLDSIINSLCYAHDRKALTAGSLTVMDDHSSLDARLSMQAVLARSPVPATLESAPERGNGASLAASFAWARTHADGLFYLVEDDYLHQESAIAEMLGAFQAGSAMFNHDVVIFPCDYPDRYQEPYPSTVLLAPQRYWRTVRHTTGTFMTSRANLERYWPLYQKLCLYGIDPTVSEANTLNLIYEHTACLSPMPSLTKHMHEGLDSPFTPWREWWRTTRMPDVAAP